MRYQIPAISKLFKCLFCLTEREALRKRWDQSWSTRQTWDHVGDGGRGALGSIPSHDAVEERGPPRGGPVTLHALRAVINLPTVRGVVVVVLLVKVLIREGLNLVIVWVFLNIRGLVRLGAAAAAAAAAAGVGLFLGGKVNGILFTSENNSRENIIYFFRPSMLRLAWSYLFYSYRVGQI